MAFVEFNIFPRNILKTSSSRFVETSTAKAAKRLRGYLIRLTRGYTDGGMDSRADKN
jgi:hypothetical protein